MLKDLMILITRPKELCQPLFSLIENLGGKPKAFSTIEIVDTPDINLLHEKIKSLVDMDICLFTSQHAVMKSMPVIKSYFRELPNHLQIGAIGKATKERLQTYNIVATLCPSSNFTSEGLLALPELQEIKGKKILIIKGEGGREHLADTLIERGATIYTASAYGRQLPKHFKIPVEFNEIDIITSTSSESLDNLYHMLFEQKEMLCRKPLIVISERMAHLAKKLGFSKQIFITKEVSNQAIVDCLIQFKGKHCYGTTHSHIT